jgi:hypothetical protein
MARKTDVGSSNDPDLLRRLEAGDERERLEDEIELLRRQMQKALDTRRAGPKPPKREYARTKREPTKDALRSLLLEDGSKPKSKSYERLCRILRNQGVETSPGTIKTAIKEIKAEIKARRPSK